MIPDPQLYRRGIARLLQCFGRGHPLYSKVLACRNLLHDRPSSTALAELDRISRQKVGVSFEALCRVPEPAADIDALLDEGCFEELTRLWRQAAAPYDRH